MESRPEELADDNWADGPIEMPMASLTARFLGIPVAGIDWWQKAGSQPGTSSTPREEQMFENLISRLPGYRKVLVLVGYSRVPELRTRLEQAGYSTAESDRADKEAMFSAEGGRRSFPPGMQRYLQKYIDRARDEIEHETDPAWKSALAANLAVRQKLLDLVDEIGERPSQ